MVTRWYRCPELLFGARQYNVGVDIWAVGCILAELLLRVPFLPGDSDLDQLSKIFVTLGSPTDENWPDIKLLPDYMKFNSQPSIPFHHIFTAAPNDLLQLLEKLLALCPSNRCTCTEALNMPYFSNKPAPTVGEKLPMPSSCVQPEQSKLTLKRKINDPDGGLMPKKRLQF